MIILRSVELAKKASTSHIHQIQLHLYFLAKLLEEFSAKAAKIVQELQHEIK